MKEFEWFEWFEWFGPSPIEPFNPGLPMEALLPENKADVPGDVPRPLWLDI